MYICIYVCIYVCRRLAPGSLAAASAESVDEAALVPEAALAEAAVAVSDPLQVGPRALRRGRCPDQGCRSGRTTSVFAVSSLLSPSLSLSFLSL